MQKTEIPSSYNPKTVEERWYRFWEENGFFHAVPDTSKKPFSIVIPPPNVTGILHMGHALNNTIQDILIRYKRMRGFEALWMPGTDHAGIATQNVVEKKIAKEGLTRQDLGREKFVERVWQWKDEYGSTIISQLRKLGSSCDWERLRFTMDEAYSSAVVEVFVELYAQGLIYRGNRIINWCPRCQTALSDEEAPHQELQGHLYYIKYPIKQSPVTRHQTPAKEEFVVVATTRPETMLGDTAVAVNPADERYRSLIGKTLVLPLLGREIPVIADEMVDPAFGTGAVKVTPAHDPNDYAAGKRHGLDFINIMRPDGVLNEQAGPYANLDRFEARKKIIADLSAQELLIKTDPHKLAAGHCYRCSTIIEPYLSKQWFISMKPLAQPAIAAVTEEKIRFYPERWTKVYLNWMENIQDWCISRQIWWGHRLPVYYCKACQAQSQEADGSLVTRHQSPVKEKTGRESGIIVSRVRPEMCPDCGSTDIVQDEDVLDTWFSSWLWPFATFGWPFTSETDGSPGHQSPATNNNKIADQQRADLNYFYPTATLVTAQEIIFFWVARMIMAGLKFRHEIPFKDIYIHGTVRDSSGKKMSKSLGNVIDPLEIINEFGTDALRFSMISMTAAGQDIFLSKQKFEFGRNFANKLWNASRFIMMNLRPEEIKTDLCVYAATTELNLADRWILSQFYRTLQKVQDSLEEYRFNEAAATLYDFIWHQFCDWYIEFSKPQIGERHTQVVLYKVLEKTLRVLHPFMPFITEEIWQNLNDVTGHPSAVSGAQDAPASIMISSWPHLQQQLIDPAADGAFATLIEVIVSIRNIRASWNINPKEALEVHIKAPAPVCETLKKSEVYLQNLAKASTVTASPHLVKPSKSATAVIREVEVYVPLALLIDFDEERSRLRQKIDEISRSTRGIEARLADDHFVGKAPAAIVEKERQRLAELSQTRTRLEANLRDLE
ncbi:MAG: valine--tRNA ligase [Candidatus Omnitrophota bacterium]